MGKLTKAVDLGPGVTYLYSPVPLHFYLQLDGIFFS